MTPKKTAAKKKAPAVTVHAEPNLTRREAAVEAERDRLHKQARRQWAEAERLERAGGDITRITLLKTSALAAQEQSHRI